MFQREVNLGEKIETVRPLIFANGIMFQREVNLNNVNLKIYQRITEFSLKK
jgi:hypothetical protein